MLAVFSMCVMILSMTMYEWSIWIEYITASKMCTASCGNASSV
jgi:hypothetical protein